MRKKTALMFRGFVFILAILVILYGLLASCTPQGRMNRAINKVEKLKDRFPNLVHKNIIYKDSTFDIPGIKTDVTANEDTTPDPKIDSLLKELANCPGKNDSVVKESLTTEKTAIKNEIKKEIAHGLQKEIRDTIITQDGVIVKITSKGGKLMIDIKTPDQKVTEKIKTEEDIIQPGPVPETGFFAWIRSIGAGIEKFFTYSGYLFWILIIVAILWKVFKPKL